MQLLKLMMREQVLLPDILGFAKCWVSYGCPSSFFAAVRVETAPLPPGVALVSFVIAVAFLGWLILQWWLFEADDHEE